MTFSEEDIHKEMQRQKKIQYNAERMKKLREEGKIKNFHTSIKSELSDRITKYLEKNDMTKTEFLELAIDTLENK